MVERKQWFSSIRSHRRRPKRRKQEWVAFRRQTTAPQIRSRRKLVAISMKQYEYNNQSISSPLKIGCSPLQNGSPKRNTYYRTFSNIKFVALSIGGYTTRRTSDGHIVSSMQRPRFTTSNWKLVSQRHTKFPKCKEQFNRIRRPFNRTADRPTLVMVYWCSKVE